MGATLLRWPREPNDLQEILQCHPVAATQSIQIDRRNLEGNVAL